MGLVLIPGSSCIPSFILNSHFQDQRDGYKAKSEEGPFTKENSQEWL